MKMRAVLAAVVVTLLAAACAIGQGSMDESTTTSATTVVSTTSGPVETSTSTATTIAGDPSLAGVQGVVRITEGPDTLAHDWGLTDPKGNYIGPVDTDGKPLLLKPIEGYGDFSGLTTQQRFDLDPTTIQRLTYRCVSDADPRFTKLITDTANFNWYQLPGRLAQVGMAVYIACQQGLHLPRLRQEDWTPDMWAEAYAYRMAWIDCIEREAHIDWGPRITLDQLIEQAGSVDLPAGHPYAGLGNATLQRLDTACPARPPGGFGVWNPGDAVGKR